MTTLEHGGQSARATDAAVCVDGGKIIGVSGGDPRRDTYSDGLSLLCVHRRRMGPSPGRDDDVRGRRPEQVKSGQFVLVTSAVVQDERVAASPTVRHFFEELLGLAEVPDSTASALGLRDAYLQAKIVTPKYSADALHAALATVAGCLLIVSWNFQHSVHFQKIPLYNAINNLEGMTNHRQIQIYEGVYHEEVICIAIGSDFANNSDFAPALFVRSKCFESKAGMDDYGLYSRGQ